MALYISTLHLNGQGPKVQWDGGKTGQTFKHGLTILFTLQENDYSLHKIFDEICL
jgi:hypothetical protein